MQLPQHSEEVLGVRASRLPVGSSANRSSGLATSALATERAAAPAESSSGKWLRRGPSPTSSMSSAAAANRG